MPVVVDEGEGGRDDMIQAEERTNASEPGGLTNRFSSQETASAVSGILPGVYENI